MGVYSQTDIQADKILYLLFQVNPLRLYDSLGFWPQVSPLVVKWTAHNFLSLQLMQKYCTVHIYFEALQAIRSNVPWVFMFNRPDIQTVQINKKKTAYLFFSSQVKPFQTLYDSLILWPALLKSLDHGMK